MQRARTSSPPPPPGGSEPPAARISARPRSRVTEALRCAFCRDQLSRADQALVCARGGCGERMRTTWTRAVRLAVLMLPRGGQSASDYLRLLLFLLLSPAVSVGVILAAQRLRLLSSTAGGWLVLILLVAGLLLAPCVVTLVTALVFFGLRGLGRLLAGELAALDRAGQPGSYLARQARGGAKKPG